MISTTSASEIAAICQDATQGTKALKTSSDKEVAAFLTAIADGLTAAIDTLVPIAMEESNLPEARLRGEVGRTTGQLKMFAADVESGRWKNETSVEALPDRQPLPRPALHRAHLPIGPVAVFGASNFPFAFSVAGGDTASALAARCAVVVKAHPAHIKTSEAVGNIVEEAAKSCGLPASVFTLINTDAQGAQTLVKDPSIKAVGFTGSQTVGRLLMDLAASRKDPIPVFAEMGSINPSFMLPGALQQRAEAIATGYSQSLTAGVGQFCTNPGLVIGAVGNDWDLFCSTVQNTLANTGPQKMLHEGISKSYLSLTEERLSTSGVSTLVKPTEAGSPGLARVDSATYTSNRTLHDEVFGPFGLFVECSTTDEFQEIASNLEGQLTATIHHGPGDEELVKQLASILEDKVGRLIFNQYPTGLEVCDAIQHGGPYPAASDARFTSVGNHAILRWLRPICYQNKPEFLGL
ncbi:MAG TPA: aldehyde dehydrogenase (NADP(+)) [Fimbriimonas sp.]|nr:aldehyde dehydrogenase (NADP(+)) [Fimbriimonas sp.]